MFIKRVFRKPFKFILLLLLSVVGFVLLGKTKGEIFKAQDDLDKIILSMEIKCKVLPSNRFSDNPFFEKDVMDIIKGYPEVKSYYDEAFDDIYYVSQDDQGDKNKLPILISVTNNLGTFLNIHHQKLNTEEKPESFEGDICIVNKEFAQENGIRNGDSLSFYKKDGDDAFQITLKVVGILEDDEQAESTLGSQQNKGQFDVPFQVLLPESTFFSPKLLGTETLQVQSGYYCTFEFVIDPKYNRSFEKIEKTIKGLLGRSYMLKSNSREYYNTLKPLEEKIDLQKTIYRVTQIIFVFLFLLMVYLIAKSEKDEILIRLIFGEKKRTIFMSEWIMHSILFVLVLFMSYGISRIFYPIEFMIPIEFSVAAIVATGIVFNIIISKNILKLYQDKEG